MKREGIVIVIVGLIFAALAVIGYIFTKKQLEEKDTESISKLASDYEQLERTYYNEIQRIDDQVILYPNPDSLRSLLYAKYKEIRQEKDRLADPTQTNDIIASLSTFYENKEGYNKVLNDFYDYKDNYTANEISNLKEMVEMYKQKLDNILAQNNSLVRRLNILTSKLRTAEKEVASLEDSRQRLDSLVVEQEQTRSALDDVAGDRDRLKELLEKSEELVQRQREELERLKGLTRRAYNFTAEYEYKKRMVPLDETGKHTRNQVGKEMSVKFDVGEGLFEDGDDARVVYLTLFFEGQPYRIVKEPIRVDQNNQALQEIVFDDKLEKGNYYFTLTYQEDPIMEDYKFLID
ncbi:MAG: hypothetical protein AAF740_05240 [Bacteroidota bacterium]